MWKEHENKLMVLVTETDGDDKYHITGKHQNRVRFHFWCPFYGGIYGVFMKKRVKGP